MKLSIAIPVRNGARYLRECLLSAMNQTRQPDEILVVDNLSNDETPAIAQSRAFAGRVVYHLNAASTEYVDNWNCAAERATGDFVSILHHDDLLHPQYLASVEGTLKGNPDVGHVYTACDYINERGERIRSLGRTSAEPVRYSGREYAHNYLDGVLRNNHIHRCPGVTTRRDLLLRACRYRKEAGAVADDDFFLRIGAFTDVIGIGKPLASYRIHSGSGSANIALSLELAQYYVFQSTWQVKNATLLDGTDVERIYGQAVRFINLLLCQGLNYKRDDWVAKALSLRMQFESLLPGFMAKALPHWARPLWRLVRSGEGGFSARLYARSIAYAVAFRDALRRGLHDSALRANVS